MEKQQLQDQLNQLSNAVESLQASDKEKNTLTVLIQDIEQQLAQPLLVNEPHDLVEQVDTMVSSFERDHPTIAGILNNIMLTLTSMGV